MSDRLASIQAGLAEGLSRRAIARSLGISDKTVRNILRTADESAPLIGGDRVLEPIDPATGKHPIPGDRRYIACTCGGPAWRIGTTDEYQCEAPVGPRGPHGPRQVLDATGTPQIAWAPFRLRPFPASPA